MEAPQATVEAGARPERRGVSGRSVIEAAKEAVATIDLADLLCGSGKMRKVGKEWVARCPLPDHEDRIPSFCVNDAENVWFCHGCVRGGDVIELARFAWGYEKAEVATAAAMLLMEFGHEVPPRPPAWFAKQARQKPTRDALQEAKIHSICRRVYRMLLPLAEEIEDEAERRAEREYLWDAAEEIAVLVWAGRRAT